MANLFFTVEDIFTKGREVAVTGTPAARLSPGQSFTLRGDHGDHTVTIIMIENTRGELPEATPETGEVALTLGGITRADIGKGDRLLA